VVCRLLSTQRNIAHLSSETRFIMVSHGRQNNIHFLNAAIQKQLYKWNATSVCLYTVNYYCCLKDVEKQIIIVNDELNHSVRTCTLIAFNIISPQFVSLKSVVCRICSKSDFLVYFQPTVFPCCQQ
jgi:hypothetical protein